MKVRRMLSAALLCGAVALPANAASEWPLWNSYAGHFVSHDGRVIDPDREGMTTSEGQSYALFFALVANDRRAFQNILDWTENNLSDGDIAKQLPAWSWGRNSDGEWEVLDPNSASDSDLWIAYSLLEAGQLWDNAAYSRKGSGMLSHITETEVAHVPHAGTVMVPGRSGFQHGDAWILNPSYLPLPLLFAMSHFDPGGPWRQMALNLPVWLKQASPAGFAMDWVKCEAGGFSASSGPAGTPGPGRGSYDAIRVYLWAGMTSKKTPGATDLLALFAPMLRYVKAHMLPPESVAAGGTVLSTQAPMSFLAALIPFAVSSGSAALATQMRGTVTSQISRSTGLLGSPAKYYDQNLALFALGWQEQHFSFAPDGTLRVPWKK